MYYMRTNIKLLFFYLLIFCVCIFLSGHSYSIVVGSGIDIVMITIGLIACVWISPRLELPKRLNANGFFLICITIGALMSYMLYSGQNVWIDPLLLLGKILLAYLITQRLHFKDYARLFVDVMTLLSTIAICVYALLRAGVTIPSFSYMGLDGRGIYHTIWLCTWSDFSERLMGPFWEAGLFSSMAVYALLCEGCFTGRKPRKLPIAIILIGIILTNSTAGYLLALLSLYIIYFQLKSHRGLVDIITLIVVIVLFLFREIIIESLVSLNHDVFWKLNEKNISANTRLLSPVACFQVFLKNPLTGLGISYATDQYNLYKSIFGMDALTSTSTFMLAAFGIWGGSYTWFLCRGAWKQKQFGITTRILLVIILLLIVNKEPHTSIIFTYIMMFYMNKCEDNGEVLLLSGKTFYMDKG